MRGREQCEIDSWTSFALMSKASSFALRSFCLIRFTLKAMEMMITVMKT